MKPIDIGFGPKSLLIWAYAIGCFDLIAALLFMIVGLRTIHQRLSWLIIFAIIFAIFWISMIVMLLLGIHGRKPEYVRTWIIFSCGSILAEIFMLLYGILGRSCWQKGLIRNGILLVIGMYVEFVFLFIIHQFYLKLEHYEACHPHVKCKKKSVSSARSRPPSPFFPKNATLLQTFDKHSAP